MWPLNYQALHIKSDADGFYQWSSILGLKEVRLQRLQKVTQDGKLNLKLDSFRDILWCKAERIAFLSCCKAARIQNSQCRISSLVLLLWRICCCIYMNEFCKAQQPRLKDEELMHIFVIRFLVTKHETDLCLHIRNQCCTKAICFHKLSIEIEKVIVPALRFALRKGSKSLNKRD